MAKFWGKKTQFWHLESYYLYIAGGIAWHTIRMVVLEHPVFRQNWGHYRDRNPKGNV